MKLKNFQFILIFSAILYLAFLGAYPLFDKDEPYYAEAAREMIESNSYIIPYFNYVPRYEKPILFYLLEVVSFKAFGVNEFAARLPSALLAIALLLINYFFAKRFATDSEEDTRFALYSSLILATSLEFFILARMSITDMALNFFISTALICFFIFYEKNIFNGSTKTQPMFLYLSATAIAVGVLTKGPIAILLPGLIVTIFLLVSGKLLYFIRKFFLEILLSIFIIALIAAPWYIAAHIESSGDFTKAFFLEENFNRFFSSVKVHKASPWWFYLPVVLLGFMPWTLALPKALSGLKSRLTRNDIKKDLLIYALIWFLCFFLFYSIAKVKLINYILPVYLPLSLIVAMALTDLKKTFFRILGIVFVLYFLAAAFLFPMLNNKKQYTLIRFAKTAPPSQKLYSIGFESPVAVFSAKREIHLIKLKEFTHKVDSNEQAHFIIRNSEYEKLPESYRKLIIITAEDRKNFYGFIGAKKSN